MGAIKDERAQEADQSLIDAPSMAVEIALDFKDVESIREVMTDPDTDNYPHTSGNIHASWCQWCWNLPSIPVDRRCNLMGYDNDKIMNYELGTFNDFLTVANVAQVIPLDFQFLL